MMLVSAFAGPYFIYGLINICNLFYDITNMYGLIINMCNLVMILQRILDVINFINPISFLLVLGGLGECLYLSKQVVEQSSSPFIQNKL